MKRYIKELALDMSRKYTEIKPEIMTRYKYYELGLITELDTINSISDCINKHVDFENWFKKTFDKH